MLPVEWERACCERLALETRPARGGKTCCMAGGERAVAGSARGPERLTAGERRALGRRSGWALLSPSGAIKHLCGGWDSLG